MENRKDKRVIHGLCITFLCCLIVNGFLFFSEWIEEKHDAAASAYSVEYTIRENRDILQGLLQERWISLTFAEKQAVLQQAANTEANYLGISKPLRVTIVDLDDRVHGRYIKKDHAVQINRDHVENSPAEEVLTTICHEAYHAYQTAVVETFAHAEKEKQPLLLFRRAEIYQEELQQYQDGSSGYEGYYAQELEKDARAYSRSAVKDWYAKLE